MPYICARGLERIANLSAKRSRDLQKTPSFAVANAAFVNASVGLLRKGRLLSGIPCLCRRCFCWPVPNVCRPCQAVSP